MALRNAFENLAVESKQDSIITALGNLLTELQQKYEGGAIALDAATLAALESITATIANWPAEYPLPVAQVGTLTPQKNALTDGQLRATPVPVTVNNQPTIETGLAKEATLASILGQLDDATTDTVLSVLKALLTELGQKLEPGGSVAVSNFPTVQTVQDGGGSLTVDGTVTVANPTFDVTVSNFPVGGDASEDSLLDIKRAITDYEERYEFDAAGLPLYVGKAPDGTLTGTAQWTVYKFTFVNGLPQRKQVRDGIAWDNRATAGW